MPHTLTHTHADTPTATDMRRVDAHVVRFSARMGRPFLVLRLHERRAHDQDASSSVFTPVVFTRAPTGVPSDRANTPACQGAGAGAPST